MDPRDVTQRPAKVNWLSVVGGIFIALLSGLIAGLVGGVIGMALIGTGPDGLSHSKAPGILILLFGVAAPLLVAGGMWARSRRSAPDFSKGVIIGGAIAVLIAGVCSGTFLFGY